MRCLNLWHRAALVSAAFSFDRTVCWPDTVSSKRRRNVLPEQRVILQCWPMFMFTHCSVMETHLLTLALVDSTLQCRHTKKQELNIYERSCHLVLIDIFDNVADVVSSRSTTGSWCVCVYFAFTTIYCIRFLLININQFNVLQPLCVSSVCVRKVL